MKTTNNKTKKTIYFDHASTTPVDSEVLKKMLPYFSRLFGNANSQHALGREAIKVVDGARDSIAKIINCKPNELYFTSGGTESDNWAIKGVAKANAEKGKHIIISAIEHPAVLESAKSLQKEGFKVDYLKVGHDGIVDLQNLKSLIKSDTVMIACMMANNEVGSVQPIKEIAKIAHDHGIIAFSDAVQSAGVLKIDVKELGVDLLSMSSHKIYGPKGIGALYVKSGIKINNLIDGGHQERARRGGTTNVPAVVGFSEAFKKANDDLDKNYEYVSHLRDTFIKGVSDIEGVVINGSMDNRLPANANVTFKEVDGEELLYNLDLSGICASIGSACSSGTVEPSHVLKAMGISDADAKSSIRFSFGKDNTEEEVKYAIKELKTIVERLRKDVSLFKLNKNTVKA